MVGRDDDNVLNMALMLVVGSEIEEGRSRYGGGKLKRM